MPTDRLMTVVDEQVVRAPTARILELAADVEEWPRHLKHYRFVRMLERDGHGGGTVEMSANRPFGVLDWPTWWVSTMEVRRPASPKHPSIRFRHVRGITTGMD